MVPTPPPPPALEVTTINGQVCLTPTGATQLAGYIHKMKDVAEALSRCHLIEPPKGE